MVIQREVYTNCLHIIPQLSAYPNISDMNELAEMCRSVYKPALRLRGGERDGNKKGI